MPARPPLERRVLAALDATPPRIPMLLGACGTGRTATLLRLRDQLGPGVCQYVDVERTATTPERFHSTVTRSTPFTHDGDTPRESFASAREAFERTVAFLTGSQTRDGRPAIFLFDEVLELRTFESFPGLRSVVRDLMHALAHSPNRFVLSTRYVARAHRVLRDASSSFEPIHVGGLGVPEIAAALADRARGPESQMDREETAAALLALTGGRPAYVATSIEWLRGVTERGGADPISALAALLSPGGALHAACRFDFELRLHRARGYGALKAILDVLAEEEPLTLTEIAQRLRRTPGSTKDYLSWLEDVDLVSAEHKKYRFSDPLLRLWVRLHCRSVPPTEEEVAREVHTFAIDRLPHAEPAMAFAGAGRPSGDDHERGKWGIIEID